VVSEEKLTLVSPGFNWFSLWTYVLLPTSVLMVWVIESTSLLFLVLWFPFSFLNILLVAGLHLRHLWAWRANWVPIFSLALFLSIPSSPTLTENRLAFWISFTLIFGVCLIGWLLPNYRYWRKRRPLFLNITFREGFAIMASTIEGFIVRLFGLSGGQK
jgi:hypothetical protein